MPSLLTEITEISTALGTLGRDIDDVLGRKPTELLNVAPPVWSRVVAAYQGGRHSGSFDTAFANGAAFLAAEEGLRRRLPRTIEWKGIHRPPGDDAIPADIRIDHVYLVSCKYLSRVLVNAGPARLFDRLLAGDRRTADNWFAVTAPIEYRGFYDAAREVTGLAELPADPIHLTSDKQQLLRRALADRALPIELQPLWSVLCHKVAAVSAERWSDALASPKAKLHLLWRLLRVSNATYFVLGTDGATHIRLRVASTWDWDQDFELRSLAIEPQSAGQPVVVWRADLLDRTTGAVREIVGHVEVRWSHGRFVGTPEAKVYLDVPHASVAGYRPLADEQETLPANEQKPLPANDQDPTPPDIAVQGRLWG